MKASTLPLLKVLAVVFGLYVVLTAISHYVVLPAFVPTAADPALVDAYTWRTTLYFLLLGVIATGAAAFVLERLFRPHALLQRLADAVRQPVMLIGPDNCYQIVNREAETLLGLKRRSSLGAVVDSRILAAMENGDASPDVLNLRATFEQNGLLYQVFDNPIPDSDSGGGRQRLVILRNVTNQARLRDIVGEINQTMTVLNANTLKISSSAVSLSQGATEQASSLAAITFSVDEFSKKIQGSTETTAKSTHLAAQAREVAERSGGEITNALSAMNDVQDAGIRIARIVKLIDDIAFQTNLLALNAAVEAARAGRQGKGFAVVAEEVRNLAGRSAKAAKDTAGMVEDVTERIGNASAYISKLEDMLHNIVQDSIRMADSSASASATSAEQAAGIFRVNQELGQMNSVTQNTMNAAEQTAVAVEALARQFGSLKEKLADLSVHFSEEEEPRLADNWQPPRPAINLFDDPMDTSADAKTRQTYLTRGDFPADSTMHRPANDADIPLAHWNPDRDPVHGTGPTTPLANLLHTDQYGQNYRDYLESQSIENIAAEMAKFESSLDPELKTAAEDHVVKPTQNIQLDDSEFGRY